MKLLPASIFVTGGCLAVAAAFELWLARPLLNSFDASAASPSRRAAASLHEATEVSTQAEPMRDFVDRPLFSPSRRPAPHKPLVVVASPTPSSQPSAPAAPEPVLTLLGVVITRARREAIVSVDGMRSETLSEGAAVGEWSLSKVLVDRAIFDTPHGTRELIFQPHDKNLAAPAVAVSTLSETPIAPPVRRRR